MENWKEFKINSDDSTRVILLKVTFNCKLAELALLNRRIKAEEVLIKHKEVLWPNGLYHMILEKQRLEIQIESMIESLSDLEKSSKDMFNKLWIAAVKSGYY